MDPTRNGGGLLRAGELTERGDWVAVPGGETFFRERESHSFLEEEQEPQLVERARLFFAGG